MNVLFYYILEFLNITLIARIILSWLPHNRFHPLISFIYHITEPLLKPFRNMIDPIQGIDITPIIVFVLLSFLKNLIL